MGNLTYMESDREFVRPNQSYNNSFEDTETVYSFYQSLTDEQFKKLLLDYISPKFYHWIFIVLFFLVFIVGVTGNFMVCYSVWKSRQLKTVTNYFLVNLAAADFLVLLLCLPPSVIQDVTQSWFLGAALCKIFVYLQRVSVFVSVLTLTTISVERYLAICHPLTYRRTKFKTRLALGIIWSIALATPVPEFFTIDLKHDDQVRESLRPLLSSCGPKNEKVELDFTLFLIVAFYLVPLCIMTFTYAKIARCLWTSTLDDSAVSENLHYNSGGEQLRTRRRTAKMLIVVVVVFGLCYLPIYLFEIARYLKVTDWLNSHPVALYAIVWTSRWLCYFNSAVNPLIYNFMSRRFRRQFKVACVSCCSSVTCCFGKNKKDTTIDMVGISTAYLQLDLYERERQIMTKRKSAVKRVPRVTDEVGNTARCPSEQTTSGSQELATAGRPRNQSLPSPRGRRNTLMMWL